MSGVVSIREFLPFSRCFELHRRRVGGASSIELHSAPTETKVHPR
jgi:hypothetical protein